MGVKETADQLQLWVKVKRQCALTDTHVQMARELGMKPRRLLQAESFEPDPLARRIENLHLKRFKKPEPDSVAPLLQAMHEARARARAETRERRRRKRQADIDHAEAARISLLTIRRLLPGGRFLDDDWSSLSHEEVK